MTVPRHDVEAIRAALRAAADAVASARAELDSATVGEDVLYGTRSKLCMALGLDTNASGIAIVDAVRAVIERARVAEEDSAHWAAKYGALDTRMTAICKERDALRDAIRDVLEPSRGAR